MPCSAAARPRLPTRATLSSRSKPARSDTRDGKGLDKGYDLPADRPLPRSAARTDPGTVTQILKILQTGADQAVRPAYRLPFGLLNELHHPRDMFRDLGPNWYASVMGTGIVVIAGASLPTHVPGLHGFATAVWGPGRRCPDRPDGGLDRALDPVSRPGPGPRRQPVMAQFWGAPPMALMTVGAGTLILSRAWLGPVATVDADWALWLAGTALMPIAVADAPRSRAREELPVSL